MSSRSQRTAVLLLALAAFGYSLTHRFVWDDWAIFARPWFAPPVTRPLTDLSFWLNAQISASPVGFHAVNLFLHLAACWLALDVLRRILPEPAAFIASLVFAAHPLQSEAVNYVWARSNLLMTVFCLLTLRDWLDGRRWRSLAWFAAALASKQECVALPAFLALLNVSAARPRSEWKQVAAMLAVAGAAGAWVLWAASTTAGSQAGAESTYTSGEYLIAQGAAIARYLAQFVVPGWGFSPDPVIPTHLGWVGWGLIAALAALSAWRFSRLRVGFWFLGGLLLLLPSSSVFPANDLAADRRMYLPMLAFAACAGLLLRATPRAAIAALALLLAAGSVQRTWYWHTEERLWRKALQEESANVRPRIQLARVLPPAEALPLLEEARKIDPDSPLVASELGRAYLNAGRHAEALTEFGRALALAPGNPQAMSNRGVALLLMKQNEAARADFERALRIDPCTFEALYNLRRMGVPAEQPIACRFTADQSAALAGVR